MPSRPGSIIVAITCSVVLLYTLYVARHAVLVLYIAVLLAILFDPAVRLVRRFRIGRYHPGRGAATAIVSLATAGVMVLVGLVIVRPIIGDARQIAAHWSEESARLFQWLHRRIPFSESITPDIVSRWLHSISGASPVLTFGSNVMDVLVTLLLAIYMLADGPAVFEWASSFVPAGRRRHARSVLLHAAWRTQHWVGGQGILMLTHGGSAFIAFWALGLPHFLTLAVFAAFINVIPFLGPILTLVAASLVAATAAPGKIVGVVVFYLVYHNVEGIFLQPRVMKSAVGIPGAAVIAALIIGDELAGFVGMAFSVPTAVLMAELKSRYLGPESKQDSRVEAGGDGTRERL